MPLTLLTAGAHIRRNKRLLLASGLCMSAHAALLLFGLQPTQTRAVTLDSLSAGPALVLNLAATGTHGGANAHPTPAANAVADIKPAPQNTEPKKPVEPSAASAKMADTPKAEPAKPVTKKAAPKIPEKKTENKKEKKKTAAAPRTPEPQRALANARETGVLRSANNAAAAGTTTTNTTANHSSSTASNASSSATQATGSSSKPRFRVPPSPPEYPKASRMRRQEGTVLLEVKLGNQGEQLQVVLVKSSGFPLLDRSALKAVKGWQFLPQEINGKSVSHVVRIPVRFELT